MKWLGRWIEDLGGTAKATIIAGLGAYVGINLACGIGALVSLVAGIKGIALEPAAGWRDVLDSLLLAAGAFAGVGIVGLVGKRAATKADVVDAQTRAVQAGVIPPPGSEEDAPPGALGMPLVSPAAARSSYAVAYRAGEAPLPPRPDLTDHDDGVL